METTHHSNAGLYLALVVLLLALIAVFMLPANVPALDKVRPSAHAVERHGQDAIAAREALANCGEGLRVKMCPPSERHGLSIVFWCESGGHLCPGCITTIGGIERTAFIRPCEQWRECR